MSKCITVYSLAGADPVHIQLSYSIEMLEDVQTIQCAVDEGRFPSWLQLRKFALSSMKEGNGYVPLFSELNNSRNMATSLFIDQVYSDIMVAEKCRVIS